MINVSVAQDVCRGDSLDNSTGAPGESAEPIQNPLLSVAEDPTHSAGAGSGPVFVKCRLIIPRFLTQR